MEFVEARPQRRAALTELLHLGLERDRSAVDLAALAVEGHRVVEDQLELCDELGPRGVRAAQQPLPHRWQVHRRLDLLVVRDGLGRRHVHQLHEGLRLALVLRQRPQHLIAPPNPRLDGPRSTSRPATRHSLLRDDPNRPRGTGGASGLRSSLLAVVDDPRFLVRVLHFVHRRDPGHRASLCTHIQLLSLALRHQLPARLPGLRVRVGAQDAPVRWRVPTHILATNTGVTADNNATQREARVWERNGRTALEGLREDAVLRHLGEVAPVHVRDVVQDKVVARLSLDGDHLVVHVALLGRGDGRLVGLSIHLLQLAARPQTLEGAQTLGGHLLRTHSRQPTPLAGPRHAGPHLIHGVFCLVEHRGVLEDEPHVSRELQGVRVLVRDQL
eukprot:1856855-Rhodomonas_salina.1